MATVRMYSGNGGLALPLHLRHPLVPLHVLLGHPIPPRHAAGMATPTTGTLRAAMVNSAPSHMVATVRWEIAQVDAVRVAPISTMGNRNMLEMVWNVSSFLPNPAHQLLVSKGVVWRTGNFVRGGLHDNRLISVYITILICRCMKRLG